MPKYFGYGFHHGGYAEYLNGHQRYQYHGHTHNDELDEHSLEKVDKQVVPDVGSQQVAPHNPGVPVNQSVNNEISIEDRSREHQRLVGLTNSNPVAMDLGKGKIGEALKKEQDRLQGGVRQVVERDGKPTKFSGQKMGY